MMKPLVSFTRMAAIVFASRVSSSPKKGDPTGHCTRACSTHLRYDGTPAPHTVAPEEEVDLRADTDTQKVTNPLNGE